MAEEFTADVNSFRASPCDHGASNDEDVEVQPGPQAPRGGLGVEARLCHVLARDLATVLCGSVSPSMHMGSGGAVPDT